MSPATDRAEMKKWVEPEAFAMSRDECDELNSAFESILIRSENPTLVKAIFEFWCKTRIHPLGLYAALRTGAMEPAQKVMARLMEGAAKPEPKRVQYWQNGKVKFRNR